MNTILLIYCAIFNCLFASNVLDINDGLEAFEKNEKSFLQYDFIVPGYNDWEHFVGMSAYMLQNKTIKQVVKGKTEYSNVFCQNQNVSLNTIFNIGNITKLFFTGTLLRLISENASLFPNDLDTKISFYMPQLKSHYPNSRFIDSLPKRFEYSKITLRNVLQHTAGFGNVPFSEKYRSNGVKRLTEYEFMDEEKFISSYGKPFYSNVGYNFLGMIVRSITNKSFSSLVKRYIIEPLNLKQTFTYEELISKESSVALLDKKKDIGIAQSYTFENATVYFNQKYNWDFVGSGIYSSLSDVTTFVHNFYKNDGNLLFSERIRKLRDLEAVKVTENTSYGVGQIKWSNGDVGQDDINSGLAITLRYNRSKNSSKIIAITSENLTNRLANLILLKGTVSRIPKDKTKAYLDSRVPYAEGLRNSYTMNQLTAMNKVAETKPKEFYDLYKLRLWIKSNSCYD